MYSHFRDHSRNIRNPKFQTGKNRLLLAIRPWYLETRYTTWPPHRNASRLLRCRPRVPRTRIPLEEEGEMGIRRTVSRREKEDRERGPFHQVRHVTHRRRPAATDTLTSCTSPCPRKDDRRR